MPLGQVMLVMGGIGLLGYAVHRLSAHYLKPHMPDPQEPLADIAAMPIATVVAGGAGFLVWKMYGWQ
jgi:hypothetical protein